MPDTKYEGFTNRETWFVDLHIKNDRMLYEYARPLCAQAYDTHEAARHLEGLVDSLKDLLTLKDSLFSGLISAALARVNWSEIAESLGEP